MVYNPEVKVRIEVRAQDSFGRLVACAYHTFTDDGSRPSQATLAPDYVPPEVAARRAKAPRRFVTPTDLHIPGEWD